jgi:hypothetical protein
MERSDTITLGILAHFSHFRHFYLEGYFGCFFFFGSLGGLQQLGQ